MKKNLLLWLLGLAVLAWLVFYGVRSGVDVDEFTEELAAEEKSLALLDTDSTWESWFSVQSANSKIERREAGLARSEAGIDRLEWIKSSLQSKIKVSLNNRNVEKWKSLLPRYDSVILKHKQRITRFSSMILKERESIPLDPRGSWVGTGWWNQPEKPSCREIRCPSTYTRPTPGCSFQPNITDSEWCVTQCGVLVCNEDSTTWGSSTWWTTTGGRIWWTTLWWWTWVESFCANIVCQQWLPSGCRYGEKKWCCPEIICDWGIIWWSTGVMDTWWESWWFVPAPIPTPRPFPWTTCPEILCVQPTPGCSYVWPFINEKWCGTCGTLVCSEWANQGEWSWSTSPWIKIDGATLWWWTGSDDICEKVRCLQWLPSGCRYGEKKWCCPEVICDWWWYER